MRHMKRKLLGITCAVAFSAALAAPVNADALDKGIRVSLSFAGDCTLGSDLSHGKYNSFIEVFEKHKSYAYFFENVKSIFEEDDLTIVNLEGPLTSIGTRADKEFAFRGPPDFTAILTEGSVEIVNLANNHTYDYGEKAYYDTIENLDKAGVMSYGVGKTSIAQINGLRICFLGYKAWSADSWTKNKIEADIKELKDGGASAVIVTFHGGDEGAYYPNNIQKSLYRHAIDSGADLVVGHHPHVIQGIEFYNGRYIVYSLGNFSFGGNRNPSDKDTFIFRYVFEFEEKHIAGGRAEIVPCRISSLINRNDFRPTPLQGDDAQRLVEKLINYSKPLNAGKNIMDYIGIYESKGD